MSGLIVPVCVVGLVVVVGLVSVMYAQNRRFWAESRWWENALLRRYEIEDALRKKYPHALVLPAWDVLHTTPLNSTEYVMYTVAEDPGETPERLAERIVREICSGQARSRVVPSRAILGGAP